MEHFLPYACVTSAICCFSRQDPEFIRSVQILLSLQILAGILC